ncbi:MAG: hypothetical protein FJ098_01105 [Deltaproteobacteria bacterium]|nr:hypothetical protein [Deltaproteobacteria bacterium]
MDSSRRNLLFALAGYLGLTALWFLPVLPYLGHALIGPAEDNMLLYWNLWWGNEALRDPALSLFHTRHLFHPGGHSLWLHSLSLSNVALSLPLHAVLPLPLVYNLLMLSSFPVGGLGAYLLARRFLRRDGAAFLAGFVFAFNPFHFAHSLHHLDVSSIQYLPFAVLFYLRCREAPRLRNVLLAALFVVAATLSSFYFLPQLMLFVLADVVFRSVAARRVDRAGLRAAILAGGLAVLLLSPLLVMMAREFLANADRMGTVGPDPSRWFVADLALFVLPNTYSPFWGSPETMSPRPFTGNSWEIAVFLGWLNLAAAGLALWKRPRESAWLGGMLILFLVLSLGAELHVLGEAVGPPILPWRLLDQIPVLNLGRVPSRMLVMGHLFLGILAARGLEVALLDLPRPGSWLAGGRGRAWAVAAVGAVSLVEFLGVADVCTPVHAPRVYDQIPREEGTALLNLPMDSYKFDALYMMHQTLHGIPLGDGRVSRVTDHGVRGAMAQARPEEAPEILRRYQIRWLVVHRVFYQVSPEPFLDTQFTRVWSDDTHVLYRVDDAARVTPGAPGGPAASAAPRAPAGDPAQP